MFLGLRAACPVFDDIIPILSELIDAFEVMDTPDFIDNTSKSTFLLFVGLPTFYRKSLASFAILFNSLSLVRSCFVWPCTEATEDYEATSS